MRTLLRRLKAAAVNAAVWGVAWFGIGFVVDLVFALLGGGSLHIWSTVFAGVFAGSLGALIGGGFSLFIAMNFRHGRVEELSPWRFALGGALVTVLVALAGVYLFSHESLVDAVLVDAAGLYGMMARGLLMVGGIGGATAYGTIKLAQRGAELERLYVQSDARLPGNAGG